MWQGAGERDAERRSPYIPYNSNHYNELLHYSPLHWTWITKPKCSARELERPCCSSLRPVPAPVAAMKVCTALCPLFLNPQSQWFVRESHSKTETEPGSCSSVRATHLPRAHQSLLRVLCSPVRRVCMLSCFTSVRLYCDSMDCSLPGSSVHGILQPRILHWVAIRPLGSSRPKVRTHGSYVSCTGRRVHYHWANWEADSCRSAYLYWFTLDFVKFLRTWDS